jgi:hypothetical protein
VTTPFLLDKYGYNKPDFVSTNYTGKQGGLGKAEKTKVNA